MDREGDPIAHATLNDDQPDAGKLGRNLDDDERAQLAPGGCIIIIIIIDIIFIITIMIMIFIIIIIALIDHE